jgi:hypothetical protein
MPATEGHEVRVVSVLEAPQAVGHLATLRSFRRFW